MWRREGTAALNLNFRSIRARHWMAAAARHALQRRGAPDCIHQDLGGDVHGLHGRRCSSWAPTGPGGVPEDGEKGTERGNGRRAKTCDCANSSNNSSNNTSFCTEINAETKAPEGSDRSPLPAAVVGGRKPAAPNWGFAPIPFVASGRSMPGQRLLACTREDAAILAKTEAKYPSPQEVEGGIIVRIIAAKDAQKVTSPVLRVVRNRQYGIRKGERLRLAVGGALFSGVLAALGFWQLQRMHEKQELIEYRRNHLARQPIVITASPFPWTLSAAANSNIREGKWNEGLAEELPTSNTTEWHSEPTAATPSTNQRLPALETAGRQRSISPSVHPEHSGNAYAQKPREGSKELRAAERRTQRSGRLLARASAEDVDVAVREWAYTPVVLHGVLDSSTELLVGPRPGLEMGNPGYCIVSPLRLHDGSVILVNKGHLPFKLAHLPPFPKAVDEENKLLAILQSHHSLQLLKATAEQHEQLVALQQSSKQKYVNSGAQQYLENLQRLAGSRTEPVGFVTVRGVLEPGELANSSFKALMLKNRPHEGHFNVLHPGDLVEATPGIPNRREAALLMVNAYSIVYDEDVLHPAASVGGEMRVANRFMSYEQKKKEDYLLFYADEHTHFNYACQWFLMGLCTVAMTIYKIVEVSKWRW